ncbi:unnamed protein product [Paramecium octaurelia]|uniref:Uncharacterized protein n=1 Tax=Paramecium octaurelia TaxID=43137 RepID=A0A8S1T1R6_PAROT|nr:unnamed protein product [Paramecium octaurelia]
MKHLKQGDMDRHTLIENCKHEKIITKQRQTLVIRLQCYARLPLQNCHLQQNYIEVDTISLKLKLEGLKISGDTIAASLNFIAPTIIRLKNSLDKVEHTIHTPS